MQAISDCPPLQGTWVSHLDGEANEISGSPLFIEIECEQSRSFAAIQFQSKAI
jgi:hypothetical protein